MNNFFRYKNYRTQLGANIEMLLMNTKSRHPTKISTELYVKNKNHAIQK